MSRVRSRGSKPELMVRRLLHRMGFRYRLHRRDLPGTPDLVFPARKKVVFVHGCFWHRHGDPNCRLARLPRTRREFWLPKLERNRIRDAEHIAALAARGWRTWVVWECELRQTEQVGNALRRFLTDEDQLSCRP